MNDDTPPPTRAKPRKPRLPTASRSLPSARTVPPAPVPTPPRRVATDAPSVRIELRFAPGEPTPTANPVALPPARRPEGPGIPLAHPRPTVEPSASPTPPLPIESTAPRPAFTGPIPARMLNEFVYCPRLFFYEFVEGVFVENADTLRGAALHTRVDQGNGALPTPAATKAAPPEAGTSTSEFSHQISETPRETIHSRSVQMGSDRLGVTAKMDLVEVRSAGDDLFSALQVCPVDYKAGAPREGSDGNELWDADKMQLGLQCLILRDNGYRCDEGVIYYRANKQRVHLPVTTELEAWVIDNVRKARETAAGVMPPPLAQSPKCPRCSLVTVCLPDETRLLAQSTAPVAPHSAIPHSKSGIANQKSEVPVRRLIAARDDARALYLNTPGLRIGRKDKLLQVKQERETLDEVRINDLSHVALFGNIQISTQAIQALCEAEIPVSYFSMGGWFYGLTRGHELKNVFLRIEQFRQARDACVCLKLARQFVHGKIRNHRTMLMRNHLEPPADTLLKLKQGADAALRAATLEELLGVEGNAAAVYFAQFSGMIKIGDELAEPAPTSAAGSQLAFNLNFTHRNRRPPTDPVNAMLSLAYSLLSKDCTLAALAVGFDPYLGFFHQPRFGRPALALDLMEEFRPLAAESTVLSCINNRVVTEKDFVRAGEAVNLSPNGRRRFFEVYEQRMNALLTHPVFDYKVSYRRALELQARLLAKVLTGELPEYEPLLTR